MEKICISMLPASYGDCFLISCKNTLKTNILVDTGFVSTYTNYLKPKLVEMHAAGEDLDLMIITHIDADHISGAVKFLKENGFSNDPKIIKIKEVWHNSYRHLPKQNSSNTKIENSVDKNIIKGITRRGYPLETNIDKDFKRDIGAKQGSSLGALIKHGEYSWNSSFDYKSISVENGSVIDISEEVKIRILSPDESKLNSLKQYWKKELKKMGFRSNLDGETVFDDAFEFLMAYEKNLIPKDFQKNISASKKEISDLIKESFSEDTSATNGSSIAFILEVGNKKILFLADSHPGIIRRELEKLYGGNLTWFDAIKISHHGSKGNTSPELLEIIDSNNIFISTNGRKFNHPDLVTLSRIICRKTKSTRNIIFNYKTSISKFLNQDFLKEKYNYKVQVLKEGEEYYI
ncbi:AVAST type 1 anti-phage system MBL fold metallo-hydrolase Avs1a [Priestia megaterium]|uniref:AVAST type 1 anti-phage system MBL fold metallo-hydrolase Avs1a n=1 Tax=Priestia megaterium TaxID=1404 RepID=UPI00188E2943|nr:AVAST type 1 anti-phage system MBL fold metallo-hydrolase Avs1a [Priestia megaterium]